MTGVESRLAEQIEAFHALSREALVTEWLKRCGSQPYKGIRKASLIRGIAYQLQIKALGGMKPSTSRKLLKLAIGQNKDGRKKERVQLVDRPRTQLGTRLVREWNGRTYEVVVADKGYVLNGVTHPSLSACAKAITGAHWSGPRFFGVAS
jgi:hypothetical protein